MSQSSRESRHEAPILQGGVKGRNGSEECTGTAVLLRGSVGLGWLG